MELVIGTRGSALALKQSNIIADLLRQVEPGLNIDIKVIKTLGDKKQGTADSAISDKQDWVQGLDTALVAGEIDIAIHSAKDVPIEIHPASQIYPLGRRESYYDIFIPANVNQNSLSALPSGSKIGTSSLRRAAQILYRFPELKIVPYRGNITTRIQNIEENPDLSGIILAEAGLQRLNIKTEYRQIKSETMLPAVNQGCLVGHIMLHRNDLIDLLLKIVDPRIRACFDAERQCISMLEADCHSAVGVLAVANGEDLKLSCRVLMPDGSEMIEAQAVGSIREAVKLSEVVAEKLVLRGASRILVESEKCSTKK